jgi:hypothetical protein
MIKNFIQYINESISNDDLVIFNQDEFDAAESTKGGEFVLSFFQAPECLLIDTNGNEEEYNLHQWMMKISAEFEGKSFDIYPKPDMNQKGHDVIVVYPDFPVIGKMCKVGSGTSKGEADRNLMDEPMIFVPKDFDPQKFLHETRGRKLKNFGV